MCGIAGSVQAGGTVAPEVLAAQLKCLGHRGPDASGVFSGDGGAVGQTRLAIIDLVTGDPPITSEDGAVGAALNGEIYNFGELRSELERSGHRLASTGDTEVLAHLAEGLDAVELARRLDGMFAFAVWDRRRRRLMLGRDPLGKKPLYYWQGAGRLVFASEIKALLADPGVPRRLDPSAIPAYLTFGYVPTPHTFFEEIKSLPPGHVLTAQAGEPVRVERYWTPRVPGVDGTTRLDLSPSEAAREVRELLTGGVKRRLIADVPLGAFLSGGIDSSAVVGVMAQLTDRPVQTFTIGFEDDAGYDERRYAEAVAKRFGAEHTSFVVDPDAVELVERLVWHHDQPFGDASAVPTFLLSELTRKHVTVALCGDGGDELFAGYERFAAALAMQRWGGLPRPLRRAAPAVLGTLPPAALKGRVESLHRFAAAGLGDPADAYRGWLTFVPDARRARMLPGADDWAVDQWRRLWQQSEGAETLDRLLALNLQTFLLDQLLPKMDRMSMAHGLEVRSPLLDRRLVEFALRLAPELKLRGPSLKRVLKAAVADLLPRDIRRRRKRGFVMPLDRWFRSDLQGYLDGMLGSDASRVRAHLVGSEIDALRAEHASGQRNHGRALWALLTLEVFLRREGW